MRSSRLRWLVLCVVLSLSAVLPSAVGAVAPAAVAAPSFTSGWYQLHRVVDGDTIWVKELGYSVRFAGVNAPELAAPYGPVATSTVRWLLNQPQYPGWVYLEVAAPIFDPTTNRLRAHVWFYDESWGGWWLVQEYLALFGLASVDRGYFASDLYYDALAPAEAYAQSRRCGIWGGQRC